MAWNDPSQGAMFEKMKVGERDMLVNLRPLSYNSGTSGSTQRPWMWMFEVENPTGMEFWKPFKPG